ncbi:MAG: hypothetical protein V3U82_02375 [Robiginitomaculum sp.]
MRGRRAALSLAALALASAALPHSANAAAADRPFLRAASVVIVFGGSDFSDNGGLAPVAYDFNLLDDSPSGAATPDIIGADGVTINYNNGQFNASSSGNNSGYEFDLLQTTSGGAFTSAGPHQTLDANDAYSAFGIDTDTDLDLVTGNRASQFLVVSNAKFDIFAQASNLVNTGAFSALGYQNIGYKLKVKRTGGNGAWQWGQRAQNPTTGGIGIITAINDLGDMSAGFTKVFDGGRRTAASRGSLLQQAVSFQSRYKIRQAGAVVAGLNNYDLSMGAGALGATVTYTIYTP